MSLELSRFPRNSDAHTWADHAELLCYCNGGDAFSRSDFLDQLRESQSLNLPDEEADTEEQEAPEKRADALATRLNDCFEQMAWRVASFGTAYPFRLDDESRSLQRVNTLNEQQQLYLLLLLCANLPLLPKGQRQSYTDAFERISKLALSALFPSPWQALMFAKDQSEFSGSKWQRMNQLARRMGGRGSYHAQSFRPKDNGDGQIDLAGWRQLDDCEGRNAPSWLAQCACSREGWSDKQGAVTDIRLRQHFHFAPTWLPIITIPLCFRSNNGTWAVDTEVSVMALDRLRIINLLNADALDWSTIGSTDALLHVLAVPTT